MARSRKTRLGERRSLAVGLVRRMLRRVVAGDLDPSHLDLYQGYAQVRAIYLDDSELLGDLKALVDLLGTNSSEEIRLNEALREQMLAMAREWLLQHPSAA